MQHLMLGSLEDEMCSELAEQADEINQKLAE